MSLEAQGERGQQGDRGRRGPRGRRGRRGPRGRRRHSLLRLVLTMIVLTWLLHSYFVGQGGIPGVPFVACQNQTTAFGLPGSIGSWLLGQTAKGMATTAGYAAGDALHQLETSPPTVGAVKSTWDGIFGVVKDIGSAFISGLKGGVAPSSPSPPGGGGPRLPLPMPDPVLPMTSSCCGSSGGTTSIAVTGSGPQMAARAALSAGWTGQDAVMATAIAGAESSYNPTIRNSIGASGLWQVLQSAHPSLFIGHNWQDPAQNAWMAHQVWLAAGRSWTPWTTFTSGAYRAHLAEARAAVAAAQGNAVPAVATTPATTSCTGSGSGLAVVADAQRYLGVPYLWGGTNPKVGLDCSGLVQLVYRDLGYSLPRVSQDQARAGQPVHGLANALPGDLVGFGNPATHIGIYVGNGQMIDAPHPGTSVRVEPVGHPTEIRRIIPTSTVTATAAGAPVNGERVMTFNVLGATHTVGHGRFQSRGFAPWPRRLAGVVNLVNQSGVSLAGFQELQRPQYDALKRALPGWGFYTPPGSPRGTDNTIAWRTDRWSLVKATSVRVPYIGTSVPMPMVLLQHTGGAQLWVLDVHNSSNALGPAGAARAAAVQQEIAALRSVGPPALWLGDMNARKAFYCPATRAGYVSAAPGGSSAPCRTPARSTVRIDWIMGTPDVGFSQWQLVRLPEVSDHAAAMVTAQWGGLGG